LKILGGRQGKRFTAMVWSQSSARASDFELIKAVFWAFLHKAT